MPVELLTNSFFLGYGLGGYVAHALTIEVERHGHNIPGVILAGTTPVTVRNLSPSLSGLDDEGCFEWLMGSNRAAATDTRRVLFDVFKNAIRADLEAYDGYMPNARVNAPVLVMGGSHDPRARPVSSRGGASTRMTPKSRSSTAGSSSSTRAPT